MKSGRVALYIDPDERDPQYWAVGPRIERKGSKIVWFDFAAESSFPCEFVNTLDRSGPFRLDEEDYRKALNLRGQLLGS